MKIKLLSEHARVPKKATANAAGFDLYTAAEAIINPGRNVVPLDIAIALSNGCEAHIRPRSGFSAKGMEGRKDGELFVSRMDADVIQGTLDQDFRGNVGVIIKSYEKEPFFIPAGTRIAQMVIERCYMGEFTQVDELDDTERGDGGWGHTGTR